MVALVMLFHSSEYVALHTYMFKSVPAPLPSPHVDPINSSFMQAGTQPGDSRTNTVSGEVSANCSIGWTLKQGVISLLK